MKEFGRKYEYKLYVAGAILVALFIIAGSSSAVSMKSRQSPEVPLATGTISDHINSILEPVVESGEIHFEKEAQGVYDAYTPEKLSLAKDHKVILFFKADWCPSCRTADETLNKEFASIPKNIAILKVSYDTEHALRKKYGVTIQHTFVQVDSQGNLITKWLGGVSIGEILRRVR